jgi:hypothetical protein
MRQYARAIDHRRRVIACFRCDNSGLERLRRELAHVYRLCVDYHAAYDKLVADEDAARRHEKLGLPMKDPLDPLLPPLTTAEGRKTAGITAI